MKTNMRRTQSAFTLVEIMIVVAIIGLLAALAVPGFMRARMQSQGRRIINDARQMDAAVDQWALEVGASNGTNVDTTAAAKYLKRPWPVNDLLNNAFTVNTVGPSQIQISATSKTALTGVGIDWGTY